MYWNGKGTERFIRPIRWLVALLGDAVVPFEIARSAIRQHSPPVTACSANRRSWSPSTTSTSSCRTNGVILSADERREKIETEIAALLEGKGLRVKPDPDLLHTLVYITEFPTPILGGFDSQVSGAAARGAGHRDASPSEVFLGGRCERKPRAALHRGDEHRRRPGRPGPPRQRASPPRPVQRRPVLLAAGSKEEARRPRRRPEERHVPGQGGFVFRKNGARCRAGEAARRRSRMPNAPPCCASATSPPTWSRSSPISRASSAACTPKRKANPKTVWRAIYDHYKPLSMDDEIPSTPKAALLSLADKWDTLIECFNVGLIPTGSRDPFALRRAAQGVVRIIVEGKVKFDFPSMSDRLSEFMRDRVEYYFRDVRGFAYDEVRACMAAGWSDLIDLETRLKRVQAIRPTPDFEPHRRQLQTHQEHPASRPSLADGEPIAKTCSNPARTRSLRRNPAHRRSAARIAHRPAAPQSRPLLRQSAGQRARPDSPAKPAHAAA